MSIQAQQSQGFEERHQFRLKRMLVAHDFSEAADCALADAMALSRKFDAEIVIAHVETPQSAILETQRYDEPGKHVRADLENLRRRVALAGHLCKEILRSGDVAKTLVEITADELPDLLLLGAYGTGTKDRKTLGSTAERLLRAIPCPVLSYGPKISSTLFHGNGFMSILVPIELPCPPRYLIFAVSVARLFNARMEVMHVVDMDHAQSMPHAYQDMQFTCEEIATYLRNEGVEVSGSLLFGKPDAAIVARSQELRSSLILMPLETRGRLSSAVSDNVAAGVIRKAEVPVMTYRINSS